MTLTRGTFDANSTSMTRAHYLGTKTNGRKQLDR